MSDKLPELPSTLTPLASANGWRICDEVCRAGPTDPIFEEQHSRFSVSAVLSGSFVYRSARGRVLMSPGSLLLGQQGAGFCCSHEHGKGDRCVAFYFENVWIEKFADELPGVKSIRIPCHRVPPAQAFAPLLAEIRILADGKDPDAGEELALRMAGTALRFACGGQDVKGSSPRDEQRVTEAVKIIESRLTEPLSISSLASAVDMSRYHFLRTFQRVIGETPWRYILSLRLALAAENLLTTSGRVLDVALASGFGDLSEFMRRFRLRFGVTPAEYRKRSAHRLADFPMQCR